MNEGISRKSPAEAMAGIVRYLRSEPFHRLAIILCGSLAIIISFLIAITPTRYSLSVGMVPTSTIAASRDVVDEITTEHNRSVAASAVTPTYKFSEGVTDEVGTSLDNVYTQFSAVRQYAQALPDYSPSRRYTDRELDYAAAMVTLVDLRDYQLVTLMNTVQTQYDEMSQSLKAAVRNTLQGHVTQGQENIAVDSILQIVGFRTNVSLLQNVVAPTLAAIIRPNMVIDQEATGMAREAARQAVEPLVYKQGQNIVVRGEGRIRENQIAMIKALGLLNDKGLDYRMYLGALLIITLTLTAMILLLRFCCKELLDNKRQLAMLYLTLLSVTLLSLLAKSIQNIYLAPAILAALLLSVTVGYLPAIIANAAASLIASLILSGTGSAGSLDLITILLSATISGTAASLILRRKAQRSVLLAAAGAAGAISFILVLAIGMLIGGAGSAFDRALMSLGGTALAALLCMALQPLSELVFNLPTNNRLMELSNSTQPLLRRLQLEAPGTYHHSIIVANLAETSAEAMGANALLARVGGYYHDIGKLRRPLYFKENQIGTGNMHDSTDPAVSAAIITSHVRDGLALARQHRLPRQVQQIVAQHHGNSRVAYFYSKAAKDAAAPPDDEDFRYDGTPPQSAEGAIVMLCDTIEAAVRTLSNPTPEEISAFIWKLIRGKLDEGQLQNAPLTIQDLYTIQKTCAGIVYGIFHERIEYPADDKRSALEWIKANLRSTTKAAVLVSPPQPPHKQA
ncbi:MAG: HD family phosphohydrolase [Christensenellales bacterium]